MNIIDNDLLSVQEARILAERGKEAQSILATYTQEKLDSIVEAMEREISKHIKELAVLSNEETDYGRWQDKYVKNKFVCEYIIKNIKDMKCIGVIGYNKDEAIVDIGIPVGVIVAISPVTSPVSTTIYKAIIAIKAGNAIIFSPHPRAKDVMKKTLDILIKAGEDLGLPQGALSYMSTISKVGTKELMNHPDVSLIMNTGMNKLLDMAYKSGKPLIYGGVGSGPAFIERSANIKHAVDCIISSKIFDYGILSAAEQSVVVDKAIEPEVRKIFIQAGAYFMNEKEEEQLGKMLYNQDGSLNYQMVGKSPQFLAEKAGFYVNDNINLLISFQKYVSDTNPYSKEKLCPVIAYYVEDDWRHACEKCIELLLSEGNGHTLVIHSNDSAVIEQFALKKPVGRVLVNTPATYGSMGATTNLFPAMTLGSGSAGKGITSDNVSPMNLVYIRKVGYGVRSVEDIKRECNISDESLREANVNSKEEPVDMNKLKSLFMKILDEMKK
ncbi:MAG: aldehyde dehydrogenase family protein [Filifactoraceae bacterium]